MGTLAQIARGPQRDTYAIQSLDELIRFDAQHRREPIRTIREVQHGPRRIVRVVRVLEVWPLRDPKHTRREGRVVFINHA